MNYYYVLALQFFVLTIFLYSAISSQLPDPDVLRILAQQQNNFLLNEYQRISDIKNVEKLYASRENQISMEYTTATELVDELAKSLSKLLGGKMAALRKAVQFAEDAAANYTWNNTLKLGDVQYNNAKKLNPFVMKYNPTFLQRIIANESSVHIPTEIFEGGKAMLNDLEWSNQLDHIFRIIWQNNVPSRSIYFASVTGAFRTFPGMKWSNPANSVDMYDVRRRPWYTQGSSSPKDMLVMIDTSGSMHGQALRLTKLSVENLIDTLGENDYMAVGQYPGIIDPHDKKRSDSDIQFPRDPSNNEEYANYPHLLRYNETNQCFTGFVQATKRNKDKMFELIKRVKAKGIAYLELAIEFALAQFEILDKQQNMGARCNRVIMILTDGAAENPREIIRKYKEKNPEVFKKVRIFTYAIGQNTNPTDALVNLACENKGYFAQIPAIGAVTNKVQHIATVMSRPLSLAMGKFYKWNNLYLDAMGLGLMTSVTMPVFNRTGNHTLLGVMGTDVTVKDMQDLTPIERLGPNGYAFAINTNGYIVFHPDLRGQLGWLRDPPNVDFLEVEFETEEKKILREKIINCSFDKDPNSSVMSLETMIKVSDEIHTYLRNRTYAYTYIANTTFGVAVVTPKPKALHPLFQRYNTWVRFENEEQRGGKIDPSVGLDASDYVLLENENVVVKFRDLLTKLGITVADEHLYCKSYCWAKSSAPPPTAAFSATWTTDFFARVNGSNRNTLYETRQESASFTTENTVESTITTSADCIKVDEMGKNRTCGPRRKDLDLATLLFTLRQNHTAAAAATTPNNALCWSHMVEHFFLDVKVATKQIESWIVLNNLLRSDEQESHVRNSNEPLKAVAIFLSTNSGTTFIYPANKSHQFASWKNNFKMGYYQRAIENADQLLVHLPLQKGKPPSLVPVPLPVMASLTESPLITENQTGGLYVNNTHNGTLNDNTAADMAPLKIPDIVLVQSVKVSFPVASEPSSFYEFGVVGVSIPYISFVNRLFSLHAICAESSQYTCYLLDDGAYTIGVSRNETRHLRNVGYFFGHADTAVMLHLINTSVYNFVKEYDYQASCPNLPLTESAASLRFFIPRLIPMLKFIALNLWNVMCGVMLAAVDVLSSLFKVIPSFLYYDQSRVVYAQEATASSNANKSCIKLGRRYFFGPNEQSNGFVYCGNCSRSFATQRLLDVNLLLVVISDFVSDNCSDSCASIEPPLSDPVEDPGPYICTAQPRYRRRPVECYDYDKDEVTYDCGRPPGHAMVLSFSKLCIFTSVLLAMAIFYSHNTHAFSI